MRWPFLGVGGIAGLKQGASPTGALPAHSAGGGNQMTISTSGNSVPRTNRGFSARLRRRDGAALHLLGGVLEASVAQHGCPRAACAAVTGVQPVLPELPQPLQSSAQGWKRDREENEDVRLRSSTRSKSTENNVARKAR